jgi:hypothetical protein
LTAKIERSVPDLGLRVHAMELALAGPDQMRHGMAPSDEELRDEPAVATKPRRLGAHETRARLTQGLVQRGLPLGCSHARHVAAERTEAGEALLARLAAPSAPELDRVAVGDSRRLEGVRQRCLVELRVAARAREASYVDERPDRSFAQTGDELVELSPSVTDSEDAQRDLNRIAVSEGMGLTRDA